MTSHANPRFYAFIGGNTGAWSVTLGKAVTGEPLPTVNRLDILNSDIAALPDDAQWMLRGVTSNERYVTRDENNSWRSRLHSAGRKPNTPRSSPFVRTPRGER